MLPGGLRAVALGYALLAGLKTVVDFDLGWQMAAGRFVWMHHAIARTEMLSYTARGVEWIYPVLSGVIFALLFKAGGYGAISWLCAVCCVGCAGLLGYRRGVGAVVLAVLAVPVLASEVMPRASLFTMILFAAFARVLVEHFEGRHERLWVLPGLMVLWVNLHTGFVAGLGLMAGYVLVEALEMPFRLRRAAAVERLRRAAPWVVSAAMATVVNPWGWRIFVAIARQQAAVRWQSAFVEEWAPVRLASVGQELGWRAPESARWWLLGFGLVLAAGCVWRLRFGVAAVLLGAAMIFVRHERMEGPCVVLICLIGGSVLHEAGGMSSHARRWVVWAVAPALVMLVAVRCLDVVTDRMSLAGGEVTLFGAGASWWMPESAAAFVVEHGLKPNVFTNFNLSSFVVGRLGERYPDFADGRTIPFGERLLEEQEALTALPLDAPEWTRAAERYGLHTVIFPLSRLFALGEFPLLQDCASTRWTPVYLDDTAVVFERNEAGGGVPGQLGPVDCKTQDLVGPTLVEVRSGRRWAESYERLANASAIYASLGRFAEARRAAELASAVYAGDPTLHFVKAQAALGEHRLDEAEAELQAALAVKQTDAGWYNLGLLYLTEHRFAEAVEALARSARFSHEEFERQLLIAQIYLLEQEPADALRAYTKAVRASPYEGRETPGAAEFNAEVAEGQAAAFAQLQEPARAVERQRMALQLTPDNVRRRKVMERYCAAAGLGCTRP